MRMCRYVFACVCACCTCMRHGCIYENVCACVCEREREREREAKITLRQKLPLEFFSFILGMERGLSSASMVANYNIQPEAPSGRSNRAFH